MTSKLKAWVLASRPKTLTAAVVPVCVGSAVGQLKLVEDRFLIPEWFEFRLSETWQTGLGLMSSVDFSPTVVFILILVSALCIQIATNLFNDVIDAEKGADSSTRVGPVRVVSSGLLSAKSVMMVAIGLIAIALVAGVPLVLIGGWPIVAVGLVSLFLAYGYTGGPFPLAYLGLGDLFVILFFGLIAVGGTTWIVAQSFTSTALIAGLQVGMHAAILIAVNNLRDAPEDAKVGKRTLAVRLGPKWTRVQISVMTYLPFALSSFHMMRGLEWAAFLPLVAVPLASRTVRGVWTSQGGAGLNSILGKAAGLHLIFGLALALGLALARRPFSLRGLGLD